LYLYCYIKVDGKPALLRAGGAHPIARFRRELYGLYGAGGRKHPSGGWARPLNVLASKQCTMCGGGYCTSTAVYVCFD
jgi:hypothetical protein